MKGLLFGLGLSLLATPVLAERNDTIFYAGQGDDLKTGKVATQFFEYGGFGINGGMTYVSEEKNKEDVLLSFEAEKELLDLNLGLGKLKLSALAGLEVSVARFDNSAHSGPMTGVQAQYKLFDSFGIAASINYHYPIMDPEPKLDYGLALIFSSK